MELEVSGRTVRTDEQGYLLRLDDWSEAFAEKTAEADGIRLYDDHWGLILYFRDYYQTTGSVPTSTLWCARSGASTAPVFTTRRRTGSSCTGCSRAIRCGRCANWRDC